MDGESSPPPGVFHDEDEKKVPVHKYSLNVEGRQRLFAFGGAFGC
jgi:hypothetical protein